MTMNTCQKMTVENFYKTIRQISATYRNHFDRLNQANEYLQNADVATYPDNEIDTPTLQKIVALRTAINDYITAVETVAMLDAVNDLRYMS